MNKQSSGAKTKDVPPAAKAEKQDKSQSPTKIEKPPADPKSKAEIDKNIKIQKGGKAQDNIYLTQPTPRENISPRKPENVLVSSGLLDAYSYLQDQICKHGLPKGNIFEYAAVTILKYERKSKGKQAWKKLEERDKEIEKAKKHIDLSHSPTGKSPKGRDKSPTSPKIEDPKLQAKGNERGRSKSPPPREEEIKGKTKPGDKSPPRKDEVVGATKGKGDKSPPPKEEPKGKKGDKSPPPKEDPKTKGKDAPIEVKKNEPITSKAGGGVKKK